jgi:hypothetical protein
VAKQRIRTALCTLHQRREHIRSEQPKIRKQGLGVAAAAAGQLEGAELDVPPKLPLQEPISVAIAASELKGNEAQLLRIDVALRAGVQAGTHLSTLLLRALRVEILMQARSKRGARSLATTRGLLISKTLCYPPGLVNDGGS